MVHWCSCRGSVVYCGDATASKFITDVDGHSTVTLSIYQFQVLALPNGIAVSSRLICNLAGFWDRLEFSALVYMYAVLKKRRQVKCRHSRTGHNLKTHCPSRRSRDNLRSHWMRYWAPRFWMPKPQLPMSFGMHIAQSINHMLSAFTNRPPFFFFSKLKQDFRMPLDSLFSNLSFSCLLWISSLTTTGAITTDFIPPYALCLILSITIAADETLSLFHLFAQFLNIFETLFFSHTY